MSCGAAVFHTLYKERGFRYNGMTFGNSSCEVHSMTLYMVTPSEESPWYRRKRTFLVAGGGVLACILFFGFMWARGRMNEEKPPEFTDQPLSSWVDSGPDVVPDIDNRFYEPTKESDLPPLPPPPDPSIAKMKAKGCVADGFLSAYGGDVNSSTALINRSECYYLHRALETWLEPPDFKQAREIQAGVERKDIVYGMFIAEAIDTRSEYRYPKEGRDFDFGEMCRPGTKNDWGEHTCKPSFEKKEYRKYLRYITERAMDMGIQSFLFGQVFYQDKSDLDETVMPEIIQEMRAYAEIRGMKIVIGAQTNDIANERYLRMFDFIEGGVGLSRSGWVEEGPCYSRWWQKPGDWCWALLWHPEYKNKANNVFVHFDWSGKIGDDMSVFTRMDEEKRRETLERLYRHFRGENVGFLLPLLATLHKDNDGCHGPKQRYYSASRKYSCRDEEAINDILH